MPSAIYFLLVALSGKFLYFKYLIYKKYKFTNTFSRILFHSIYHHFSKFVLRNRDTRHSAPNKGVMFRRDPILRKN